MVKSPARIVVISDNEYVRNQLEKIRMESEIEEKSVFLDRDYVIHTGHFLFYDKFLEKLKNETELASDILVKKGSDRALGMYSLGNLQDSEYKEIL